MQLQLFYYGLRNVHIIFNNIIIARLSSLFILNSESLSLLLTDVNISLFSFGEAEVDICNIYAYI